MIDAHEVFEVKLLGALWSNKYLCSISSSADAKMQQMSPFQC